MPPELAEREAEEVEQAPQRACQEASCAAKAGLDILEGHGVEEQEGAQLP